tara:strand:+ start:6824 stop:7180 length:357 start_codon:yes stop_codon:yes gene_type:complete
MSDYVAGEQQAPVKNGIEIYPKLKQQFSHIKSPLLLDIINKRYKFGLDKYGQPLMSQDGRDTYKDIMDELGDAAQYIAKLKIEVGFEPTPEDIERIDNIIHVCDSLIQLTLTSVFDWE